jgi:hypothetical protein
MDGIPPQPVRNEKVDEQSEVAIVGDDQSRYVLLGVRPVEPGLLPLLLLLASL